MCVCLLLLQVTSRAVGILQPLVLGWTSLASSGLLPKGLNTARAALQVWLVLALLIAAVCKWVSVHMLHVQHCRCLAHCHAHSVIGG